jgi:hypothetical protein
MVKSAFIALVVLLFVGFAVTIAFFFGAGFSKASNSLVQEKFYLNYHNIKSADGPIDGNWIPDILPTSASHLIIKRDRDAYQACAMFQVGPDDTQVLTESCTTVSLEDISLPLERFAEPIAWWPKTLNRRNDLLFYQFHSRSESQVKRFFAVDIKSKTIWYWLRRYE